MSKRNTINLCNEDRSFLENLISSGTSKVRVQTRARILLLTDYSQDEHMADDHIAQALMISVGTVVRIRSRFISGGLDEALYEKPRPGQPPKITGDIEAQLVVLVCSNPPDGHAKWTAQLLADQLVELKLIDSISRVAVYKRLKKLSKTLACKLLVHTQGISTVRL